MENEFPAEKKREGWLGLKSDKCPLCSDLQCEKVREVSGYPVFQCRSCSFVFMPDPSGADSTIYEHGYFDQTQEKFGYSNYEKEFETHYRAFDERLRDTEKILGRKGRLLDVGCALGHCGKVAQDRGWDVFVTDLSHHSATVAHKKFNLKAFISPPSQIPAKDKSFDCISLYDVIEHTSDPWPLLKEIRRCLADGGVFHLTTPDVSSLSARWMGARWYHYKPKEHLLYFSPKTMKETLEKAGFEVVNLRSMPMHMKVRDILVRFKRYWNWGASQLLKWAEMTGLGELILKFYAGELEVWARPKNPLREAAKIPDQAPQPLLKVLCCPECHHDLVAENDGIKCVQCNSSFSINSEVIDFSKNGKKQKSTGVKVA